MSVPDPLPQNTIDNLLADRTWQLRFPTPVEAQFEADHGRDRCRHLITCGLVALGLYNLFLVSDWRIIPDIFGTAVAVRLGLVTPIALLIVASLLRDPSPFWREALQALISLIVTASVLYLTLNSKSPLHIYHHNGIVLVVLFANIVQRLQFPFAVAASIGILGLYIGALLSIESVPEQAATNAVLILAGSCIFTLIANYQLERQFRRSYLLSLRDRLKHEELASLSRSDPLTGLGNRRKLERYFADLWAEASERSEPVAVMLLDVDYFKLYNDCYGHQAGDICLKRVAAIIEAELRKGEDTAFRYGGEEFLVLLPDTDIMNAVRVAERIRQTFLESAIPHETSPVHSVLTVSIGVAAAAPCGNITPEELVSSADAALYAAKRHGRNQVWPPRKLQIASVADLDELRSGKRDTSRH